MPAIAKTLLLLLMISATAATAHAETLTNKTFSYFSVGGKTAAELDDELSKRGPKMKNTGSRHPGATRIRFGGSVTYVKRGGKCYVGDAKVTLSTNIILPRWKHRRTAGKSLALIWDTLSSDIKRHEERHAEIARNHARDLEKQLKALRPDKDCDRLQEKVDRVTAAAVEAHDKDQARFDRVESHNFNERMLRLLTHKLERSK
ncbi:putative secreted Zn-dependent protease [Rhizobium azooxidifex]|uniref:Putative secreted Zn-dependent protease n=1 Tax=Mycoplana azooxidifex TaxID=1636188 RepID=A0A7W6D6M3_9HYPH|nr:putative secreted Zn-dependent protease [Mycoplana azooxidifex]